MEVALISLYYYLASSLLYHCQTKIFKKLFRWAIIYDYLFMWMIMCDYLLLLMYLMYRGVFVIICDYLLV